MAKQHEVILYEEDGWDIAKIQDIVNQKQTIKLYAIILHDQDTDDNGNPVKPHYHVYLNYGNNNVNKMSDVANWFGVKENSVERIKGQRSDVLKYYLHIGFEGKHQYHIEDITANFNVQTYLQQNERRNKLEEIIAQCAAWAITPFNYQQFISPALYAKYKAQIERSWEYAEQQYLISRNGRGESSTIWIYGESGVGKSTLALLVAEQMNKPAYLTATGKDPFSHYLGQPAIILNEIMPSEPFTYHELLETIDPHYKSPVKSRYRDKVLRADLFIITTVFSPYEFYRGFSLEAKDSRTQLLRRLSEIWHVTTDHVKISKHLHTDQFSQNIVKTNPVPAYIARQNVSTSILDSANILDAIHNQYSDAEPEQLSLFDTSGNSLPF